MAKVIARNLIFIWLALALRLQPFVHLPKYAVVTIELILLASFYWSNRERLADFYLRFARPLRLLGLGLLAGIVWACAEAGWDRLNGVHNPIYLQSLLYLPLAFLCVGWASALYEELLFRSCLLWYFTALLARPWVAVLIQGTVFFVAHGSRYFHGGYWHQAVTTGVFGLVLGVFTVRTKSVLPAWVAHTFANSYGVIFIPPEMLLDKIFGSWLR